MDWKTEVFRYFLESKMKRDGTTQPKYATHGAGCRPLDWENALKKSLFSGILNDGFVDISFDSSEQSTKIKQMIEYNHWNCLILENPTNGHVHTIWKKSGNWNCKDGENKKTAVGLVADVHSGYTFIRLREPSHERFPINNPASIDEVPDELLLVKTNKNLWNLGEGDGRNTELYSYIPVLQSQLHLTNDRCKDVLESINKFVFKEPLPDEELNTIMRDESFSKCEVHSMECISASELMKMDLPPVYFVVKDFLPMGLSVIASPPKFGKSFFSLQLCLAVASGSKFLGFDTNKSGVLYLALEDSPNRLKERLKLLNQGKSTPEDFLLTTDSASIGTGLIEQLQSTITKYPSIKLIIIDTFQKVRDGGKSNEGAYSADYREAGAIKKFADQHGIAVLLVHHTRKMKDSDDPFANISGTHGLTGAMDTMIVLTKDNRSEDLTHLHITGRDVQMNEYGLHKDKNTGLWIRYEESIEQLTAKGIMDTLIWQYTRSPIRKTIRHLTKDTGKWSGRCKDLEDASQEINDPITESLQQLANVLTEFEPAMRQVDNIKHWVVKNGSGSKIHKFEKCS